jgi:hypothetical protein
MAGFLSCVGGKMARAGEVVILVEFRWFGLEIF